jgi:chemosensory pili system protein ChpA (sensor histidine kinase/response regulator)
MVVDDDDSIREVLKVFLEIEGYRVSTARDGLDAWQQLSDGERPSLILLDLMMPRMDGEQFVRNLRATDWADIPVVIISGHKEAAEKAKELNGNCCLMKPIEFDDLMTVVQRFAKNPRQRVA